MKQVSTMMMLIIAEKVADIVKIVNMKILMIDNYNEDNKLAIKTTCKINLPTVKTCGPYVGKGLLGVRSFYHNFKTWLRFPLGHHHGFG